MYKMIAIYKTPSDPNAFDDWYKGHFEMIKKVPFIKEIRMSKITGSPKGESDLRLIAELLFESKNDFNAAMKSPENMALGKDAFSHYKDILSVHFGVEESWNTHF